VPARAGSKDEARRVAESWGVREDRSEKGAGKKKAQGRGARTGGKAESAKPHVLKTEADKRADRSRDRKTSSGAAPGMGRAARFSASRPDDARTDARPARSYPPKRRSAPGPRPTPRAKNADGTSSGEQRIAKLLARAGIASRREIERMIAEGRIAFDGVVLDTPATLLSSLRGVTVDGAPVAEAETTRLFLFHKPAGCLTAERDFSGRKTIYDVLPRDYPGGLPRLMPVGRLDMNTEGLLLLTNDGELKRKMELPSTGVERTYRARAFGEISQAQLEELIHGIEIEGVRYGRIDANLERRTGRNQWIEMTLTEGKNREVRRVLEYLGLKVNRLIRTRYGAFELGDSAPGAIAEAKPHELETFIRDMRRRDK
tara:strand:+ start:178304 stop:179419 length:1116 start_codon:yes stop_codon:yes gene_type:complete